MDPVTAGAGVAVAAEAGVVTQLLVALAGPGGLVVLVAIVLFGAYMVLVKHVLPMQREGISSLLQSAKEDRAAFKESFTLITEQLNKVANRLVELEDKVDRWRKD
jgi:tryptophan 2,3-dioxygenase